MEIKNPRSTAKKKKIRKKKDKKKKFPKKLIQSVVFYKKYWNVKKAKKWLKKKKLKYSKVDVKENTLRFRQFSPKKAKAYSTSPFIVKGVRFVLGYSKKNKKIKNPSGFFSLPYKDSYEKNIKNLFNIYVQEYANGTFVARAEASHLYLDKVPKDIYSSRFKSRKKAVADVLEKIKYITDQYDYKLNTPIKKK